MSTSHYTVYTDTIRRRSRYLLLPGVILAASCTDGIPLTTGLIGTPLQASAASALVIPEVDPTDLYQWRIRALDANGAGSWAVSEWFLADETTFATTGNETTPDQSSTVAVSKTRTKKIRPSTSILYSDDINIVQESIKLVSSFDDTHSLVWEPVDSALGYEIGLRSRIDNDWLVNDVYNAESLCSDNSCDIEVEIHDEFSGHKPEVAFDKTEYSGTSPLTIHIDAGLTSDIDGDELSYSWAIEGRYLEFPQTSEFDYTFTDAGFYKVYLTVTDSSGLKSKELAAVTVSAGTTFTPAAALPVETATDTTDAPVVDNTSEYQAPNTVPTDNTETPVVGSTSAIQASNTLPTDKILVSASTDTMEPASNPFEVVPPDTETASQNTSTDVAGSTDSPSGTPAETDKIEPDSSLVASVTGPTITPTVPNSVNSEGSTPDVPAITDAPSTPDVPAITDAPSTPDAPAITDAPSTPDAPAITDAPSTPDAPAITDAPSTPDAPAITDAPSTPDAPATTDTTATTTTDKVVAELPPATLELIDVSELVIVSNSVDEITATTAKVTWEVDKNATGQIHYGVTDSLAFSTYAEGTFNYSTHIQTIRDLTPGTTYYYSVESMDEEGNSVVSAVKQFQTLAAAAAIISTPVVATDPDPVLSAGMPASYATWANSTPSYDENRAMGGLFFGNPQAGGYGASNTAIGTDQAVRFRSQKTGSLVAVKVANRYLRDKDITYRCGRSKTHGEVRYEFYCDCIKAGLIGSPTKNSKCMYAISGSGYLVGNGGSYDVEVREIASTGWPDFTKPALGTSLSRHIPIDHPQGSWDEIAITPAPVVAGKEYFIVFNNKTPPPGNVLSGLTAAKAAAMPDNAGAMSLNGMMYEDAPDSSKRQGPYFSTNAHRTYYSRDNRRTWKVDARTVAWWVAKYEDGLWIGQTHAASGGRSYQAKTVPDDTRIVGGNTKIKQHFKPQADFRLNGVWINFGHKPNLANGSAMTVHLKNSAGNVIASATMAHNKKLYAINNSGLSPFNQRKYNAKSWNYAELNTEVSLSANSDYTVELSAPSGAGFVITGYETMAHGTGEKGYNPEQVIISDIGGYAEASLNNGSSWIPYGLPGTSYADKDQLPILFTTAGGPKWLD